MRGLERRVDILEHRSGVNPFDGLTDDELRAQALDIFEQMDAMDVALPDDWRERFERDPYLLAVAVGKEMKE